MLLRDSLHAGESWEIIKLHPQKLCSNIRFLILGPLTLTQKDEGTKRNLERRNIKKKTAIISREHWVISTSNKVGVNTNCREWRNVLVFSDATEDIISDENTCKSKTAFQADGVWLPDRNLKVSVLASFAQCSKWPSSSNNHIYMKLFCLGHRNLLSHSETSFAVTALRKAKVNH